MTQVTASTMSALEPAFARDSPADDHRSADHDAVVGGAARISCVPFRRCCHEPRFSREWRIRQKWYCPAPALNSEQNASPPSARGSTNGRSDPAVICIRSGIQ